MLREEVKIVISLLRSLQYDYVATVKKPRSYWLYGNGNIGVRTPDSRFIEIIDDPRTPEVTVELLVSGIHRLSIDLHSPDSISELAELFSDRSIYVEIDQK